MNPFEKIHLEQLVQRIAPGSQFIGTWHLEGGLSAGMSVFELATWDGETRKLILRKPGEKTLKANSHAAEDEYRLLEITQRMGILSPKPVFLDTSKEIFSTPVLVIEYIEGEPVYSPRDQVAYAQQLAEHLARIHRVAESDADLSFLHSQDDKCPELRSLPTSQPALLWEADRIRRVLTSTTLREQHNPPALLHGDYWPGNMLWREDRLVGVIDWEDAVIGDPLIDLSISRLDLLWIIGLDAMNAFTRHYLSLRDVDTTYLAYWDLCAALRLARLAGADLTAWARFFHLYGRRDITADSIREDYRYFIAQALNKLTIM